MKDGDVMSFRILPVLALCLALMLLCGCGGDKSSESQTSGGAAVSAVASDPVDASSDTPAISGQPVQVQDNIAVGDWKADGAVVDVDLETGSAITTGAAAESAGTSAATQSTGTSGSSAGTSGTTQSTADDPDRETMSGFTPWQ